jgi:hypothetical protein
VYQSRAEVVPPHLVSGLPACFFRLPRRRGYSPGVAPPLVSVLRICFACCCDSLTAASLDLFFSHASCLSFRLFFEATISDCLPSPNRFRCLYSATPCVCPLSIFHHSLTVCAPACVVVRLARDPREYQALSWEFRTTRSLPLCAPLSLFTIALSHK